jgi:fibro-slime domain-containing protein
MMRGSVAVVGALTVLSLSLGSCGGGSDDAAGSGTAGGAASGAGGAAASGAGAGGSAANLGLDGAAASSAAAGGGAGGDGSAYCGNALTGTIRDFKQDHPDFEYVLGDDRGIVQPDLGVDGKPVYASSSTTPTTNGKQSFDQWYRDVPGTNVSIPLTIVLTKGSGNVWTYDNPTFFPIDDKGFGNEGNPHNYHFTFELRTEFVYLGGEVFKFTGDDDLFVFINKKLAIDLGGVHGAESDEVNLDKNAGALGIKKGGTYSLDFFFAERHTVDSNFRIDTTIASFVNCGGPVK